MKKTTMLLILLLVLAMKSHHVFAQSVTMPLMPGWNWISCPTMDTLDFATALGSFTPMQGDVIKSRWGSATYKNGQWKGTISQFFPGYGYHYMSNRTMPVMLTLSAQQPAPQLIVTTAEPTDITAVSAVSGGCITSNDGSYIYVFMKGICWATHPNPTVMNDFHTENGNGINSFTAEMTDLDLNTVYYLRAYAVTDGGTTYGEEKSFMTVSGCSGDHCYVDLDLPSGTLWATCNVGATEPEEFGDYFAWGETQPKDNYDWSTYQYYIVFGIAIHLIKYDTNDNLTTLLPEDDAATVNWGEDWRMPTEADWEELFQNTTHIWTTQNNIYGRLFTSSNGNSVFLPDAGGYNNNGFFNDMGNGYYWSSSLYTEDNYEAYLLELFNSLSGSCRINWADREFGFPVRPVHSSLQN